MSVYFVTFAVTLICFWQSGKYISDGKLMDKYAVFSILLLSIIAGLRSLNVGTDISTYVKPIFAIAESDVNYFEYLNSTFHMKSWSTIYVKNMEIGYNSLCYVVTKLTGNIHLLLFILNLLVNVPVYIGCAKFLNEKKNIWVSIFVYECILYNVSLNVMRQMIAVAFLFCATAYLIKDKNYKAYIILSLIAVSFHSSAICGLIIFVVYIFISHGNNFTFRIGKLSISSVSVKIIFFLVIGLVLIRYSRFLYVVINSINSYYSNYISGGSAFNFSIIITRLPMIIIFMINGKSFLNKNENAKFFILIFIIEMLISFFCENNTYAIRILYYFSIYNIISFAEIKSIGENKTKNNVVTVIMLLYFFTYWYYSFVIKERGETVPYAFYWQN